jgi:hypothetical protein
MTSPPVNELLDELINDEIAQLTGELRDAEGPQRTDLTFVAMKVVLPAVASFVGRAVYDQYAALRTRRQMRAALEDLSRRGLRDISASPPPDLLQRARTELSAALIEEGVGNNLADELVDRTFRRIEQHLAAAGANPDQPATPVDDSASGTDPGIDHRS